MGFSSGLSTIRGRKLYTIMKLVCGASFMMYGYDAGVLGGSSSHVSSFAVQLSRVPFELNN
jgi:hypothetical protein